MYIKCVEQYLNTYPVSYYNTEGLVLRGFTAYYNISATDLLHIIQYDCPHAYTILLMFLFQLLFSSQ